MKLFKTILDNLFILLLTGMLLASSSMPLFDKIERVRAYTRNIEFDFIGWAANAFWIKESQSTLHLPNFMSSARQHELVIQYLDQVARVQELKDQLEVIYADPKVKDPHQASAAVRQDLGQSQARLDQLSPPAEAILQQQVSVIAAEKGLTLGGQPFPPILFHVTDPPSALIVSPRSMIRQDADISIDPGMTAEQEDALENQVSKGLNMSALVVGIGGIGIYPTMVMSTTDLNWLSEVISHEWTHNFLTLRPLGVNYETTPQLRTMNETTATLVGREIGLEVLRRYYPERVPPERKKETNPDPNPPAPEAEPVFSFNAEMHQTRVTTDQLLAQGKIEQAEQYMEQRRQFMWDNGYLIRKLNQAYFAFYGAYNDVAGGSSGAAGSDPVGPAVVKLRQQSASLADFLNRISWMTSFNQLQQAVQTP